MMAQINLNVTPEFERNLRKLMKARNISNKTQAIRLLFAEAVEALKKSRPKVDYLTWLGMAKGLEQNPRPKFQTHDDLWKPGHGR